MNAVLQGFGSAFEFREMSNGTLMLKCEFTISEDAEKVFDLSKNPEIQLIQGHANCRNVPSDGTVQGQLLAEIKDKGRARNELIDIYICKMPDWIYTSGNKMSREKM